MSKTRGFTFIEILISVTIVAVLAAVGIVSFQSLSKRSRDAKRKSDLQQIRVALQQYKTDNGSYPISTGLNNSSNHWNTSRVDIETDEWIPGLVPTYLDKIPVDPINDSIWPDSEIAGQTNVYGYFSTVWCVGSTGGPEYILATRLEAGGEEESTYYENCGEWGGPAAGWHALGEL